MAVPQRKGCEGIMWINERIGCIEVHLPNSPLRCTNSYLIRGKERNLIIDTGFQMPECYEAFQKGLKELDVDIDKTDFFLTHQHADHTGLVPSVASSQSRIYISQIDLDYLKKVISGEFHQRLKARFITEGFPAALAEEYVVSGVMRKRGLQALDDRFTGLQDSARLGEYGPVLQAIHVPGHTPGQMMLYDEENQYMFTGDHVLFNISPNITAWVDREDSLGDYLSSLLKSKAYPVRQAFPGHRMAGDYRSRIDELLNHHVHRFDEIRAILDAHPNLHAYDITRRMTWHVNVTGWAHVPLAQKWFAMGECLSHMDRLVKLGCVEKTMKNDIVRYKNCK